MEDMEKLNISIEEASKYAILMETNGKELESWYYFIKYQGNEESLQHLKSQLESIDFFVLDDYSTFDIETEHLVSETTAKELTAIEINSYMFHRKFDGTMDTINIGLKRTDSNERKIRKCFRKLGYGKIEDYVSNEDITVTPIDGSESSAEVESLTESPPRRMPTVFNRKH